MSAKPNFNYTNVGISTGLVVSTVTFSESITERDIVQILNQETK